MNSDGPQVERRGASGSGAFVLGSPEISSDGLLPAEFTADGASATLPLSWTGDPAATKSYAVIMHHLAPGGEVKCYWILYGLPAEVTSLPKNVTGTGTWESTR